jgi:hypothetical protein
VRNVFFLPSTLTIALCAGLLGCSVNRVGLLSREGGADDAPVDLPPPHDAAADADGPVGDGAADAADGARDAGGADADAGRDAAGDADSGSSCAAGTHLCGAQCAANVPANGCGGPSCAACPVPAHGQSTCAVEACDFVCDPGFHACGNACASDHDVMTCGSSCAPCQTPQNGAATCDGTSCGIACDANFLPQAGMCVSGCSSACDSGAFPVTAPGGRFTGTTVGKTASSTGSCGGGAAPEAVFRLSLAVTSDLFVTTHGTGFDTVVYVRRGGCCGQEISCNDDADDRNTSVVRQRALPAGVYYIFVDGATAADAGSFTVDIYATPTSTTLGDACGAPVRIAGTAPAYGTSCDFHDDYTPNAGCASDPSDGPDAVYYFVLDAPTNVTFDTCTGTCIDTLLYLRDVCTSAPSQRACDDDSCTGSTCTTQGSPRQSRATALLQAGVHYLILDTHAGASGSTCGPFTITPAGVPQ